MSEEKRELFQRLAIQPVIAHDGREYLYHRATGELRRKYPKSSQLSKKEKAAIKREFHRGPNGKKLTKRERAALESAEAKRMNQLQARGSDADA